MAVLLGDPSGFHPFHHPADRGGQGGGTPVCEFLGSEQTPHLVETTQNPLSLLLLDPRATLTVCTHSKCMGVLDPIPGAHLEGAVVSYQRNLHLH
jgi:hypothetical protein